MRVLVQAAAMIAILSAVPAAATTITLNAVDMGWYDSTGFHDASNTNYVAGRQRNGSDFNNFFVFNLAGVTDTIVGATLRLSTFDFTSQGSNTETYTVSDVSTLIAQLVAGGSGQVARFTDLGSGTAFGSRIYSDADDNQDRDITLNAAGIAAIQAAATQGQQFALGGSIGSTLNGNQNQWAFGFSGIGGIQQLILNTQPAAPAPPAAVPEPASLLLLGSGALGLAARARRRRK